jgi:hypothetical protein
VIIECLTCDKPVIADRHLIRKPDGTATLDMYCATCGAVYAVEIRELRASQRTPEEIAARRNKTS